MQALEGAQGEILIEILIPNVGTPQDDSISISLSLHALCSVLVF